MESGGTNLTHSSQLRKLSSTVKDRICSLAFPSCSTPRCRRCIPREPPRSKRKWACKDVVSRCQSALPCQWKIHVNNTWLRNRQHTLTSIQSKFSHLILMTFGPVTANSALAPPLSDMPLSPSDVLIKQLINPEGVFLSFFLSILGIVAYVIHTRSPLLDACPGLVWRRDDTYVRPALLPSTRDATLRRLQSA